MKRIFKTIILFFTVVLLLAALTNPDKEQHKEKVKEKINAIMQESLGESMSETENGLENLGSFLGYMIGGTLVDAMVNRVITVDNYIFFSVTKANWGEESKEIGIGIFGNVFLGEFDESKLGEW